MKASYRIFSLFSFCVGLGVSASAAHVTHPALTAHHAKAIEHLPAKSHTPLRKPAVTASAVHRPVGHTTPRKLAATTLTPSRRARTATTARLRRATLVHHYYEHFTANSFFPGDIGAGDITAGEDPIVRQAAINALGGMNGTAVVIDPSSGRILAMVNQKLALSPGAEPCSTIKLTVALAALSEGIVTRDTPVQLPGFRMNLTQALAKSNNLYFEEMGRELGFERVHHYATQFGLGELAGYNLQGEHLGEYPDQPIPESQGGVGRMCSFGQGVSLTPLQLGALVAAIANGGTLYYLQHPTTPDEAANFEPRVKRTLKIAPYIPDVVDGMEGAVDYGTARSLHANFNALPVFGKTGTCSDSPQGSLVTVFFLEGGRATFGPRAAELTGVFYKNLLESDYFSQMNQEAKAHPASNTHTGTGASQ
jgi:hypothetical protein